MTHNFAAAEDQFGWERQDLPSQNPRAAKTDILLVGRFDAIK